MVFKNYSFIAFVYAFTLLQLSCGNNKDEPVKKTDIESKEFRKPCFFTASKLGTHANSLPSSSAPSGRFEAEYIISSPSGS